MKFYLKKKYGESKISYCPFCNKIATQKNQQGLEVCYQHNKEVLPEFKCSCGLWLEQRSGKFGAYFNCSKCGNINLKKGLENNEINNSNPNINSKQISRNINLTVASEIITDNKKQLTNTAEKNHQDYENKKEKKEITITSDDVEYFS